MKVGVSPFGIWRPGNPAQIKGFDAYAQIYADSKKWLQNGWLDYLAPQLYWPIKPPRSEFSRTVRLVAQREHETPAHVARPRDVPRHGEQRAAHSVAGDRRRDRYDAHPSLRAIGVGHIHFNMSALMKDPDGLNEKLAARYAAPALVPASPWLGAKAPTRPTISLGKDRGTREPVLTLTPVKGTTPWLWTVRSLSNGTWTSEVLPGWLRSHRFAAAAVDRVYVTAVSRTGVESAAAFAAPRTP